MSEYTVDFFTTIEAESREEAERKARKKISRGGGSKEIEARRDEDT